MAKKIGVITSLFATNFGAALQCYALKNVLENMGYEVEYVPYKQPRLYKLFYPYHWQYYLSRSFKIVIAKLRKRKAIIAKWKNFEIFRLNNISKCRKFTLEIPEDKDYYILGSDQIWNPSITLGFDNVFWGQFSHSPSSKIISYAASTEDMQYTDDNKAYIKNALNSINCISVREDQLNKDLRIISGRNDITTVLDPTLLVDKEFYENLNLERPIPDRYILFYKIRKCSSFIQPINQFAKSNDLKLIILSSSVELGLQEIARQDNNILYFPTAGVEFFVSSVKYAEHIFTPSFHGTAFSIIFEKRFNTLVINDNWNTRTDELLSKLGLGDRKLREGDVITRIDPDYGKANIELAKLRDRSFTFLKESLMS